jgi:hypothetical protein
METKKFLDPQTLQILNYTSMETDVVRITNAQLGEALDLGQGLIEYVTSAVFPGIESSMDTEKPFKDYMYNQEARFVLEAAEKHLSYENLEHIRGHNVVFKDGNPFLADAYGKLIMKIANRGEILYANKQDALYDIYVAGISLQALYLKHVGTSLNEYLNNPRFMECTTYYDVYQTILVIDPTLKVEVLSRDVFPQVYARYKNNQWKWIADEFERVDEQGFLRHMYNIVEKELNEKHANTHLISNFKLFVEKVIEKCPAESRAVYSAEMGVMFSSYDNEMLLKLAKRYSTKSEPNTLPREIKRIDFIPIPLNVSKAPVIVLTRDTDAAFETIGAAAYRKMINRLGFMGISGSFRYLIQEYKNACKGYFRNRFADIILATVKPLRNDPNLKKKRIVFDNPTSFFGGEENFVGKAIEITVSQTKKSKSKSKSKQDPPVLGDPMLLRVGNTEKFTYSENITALSKSLFSLNPDASIDKKVVAWVGNRFKEFARTYIYIHDNFIAPANFNLEDFFKHVYKKYISNLNNNFSEKFHPNNAISKLFVDLITTNLTPLLVDGNIDMAMFTEYQKIGRTILEEDTDLVRKFKYGEAYITGSLGKYFSLEDSDKMLPLIFGPRDTMFEQLREFGGRFSAIDTNKTTIVRINFWAY